MLLVYKNMKTKTELKIRAIVVLVISGLSLITMILSLIFLIFFPMFAEAKNIAFSQYNFFIWNIVWIIIGTGLIISGIGLLKYKKWSSKSIIVFSLLGLMGTIWSVLRTGNIGIFGFLYYGAILIYFGRKKMITFK